MDEMSSMRMKHRWLIKQYTSQFHTYLDLTLWVQMWWKCEIQKFWILGFPCFWHIDPRIHLNTMNNKKQAHTHTYIQTHITVAHRCWLDSLKRDRTTTQNTRQICVGCIVASYHRILWLSEWTIGTNPGRYRRTSNNSSSGRDMIAQSRISTWATQIEHSIFDQQDCSSNEKSTTAWTNIPCACTRKQRGGDGGVEHNQQ